MAGRLVAREDVKVVGQGLPIDVVRGGEHLDERRARIRDVGREVRVQLDAVARRERHELLDRRAPVDGRCEHSELLPQLHGRGAVAQAETDEAVDGHERPLYRACGKTVHG